VEAPLGIHSSSILSDYGFSDTSATPPGDGVARYWTFMLGETGSERYGTVTMHRNGFANMRSGDIENLPTLYHHVAGAHPLELEGGWMDSHEAVQRAAELEPQWNVTMERGLARVLMVLHHPGTTERPVWAFEASERAVSERIVLVLDAMTGQRLDPQQVYPGNPEERGQATLARRPPETAELQHGISLDHRDGRYLEITVQPADEPTPLTHVRGRVESPDGGSEPFPDSWPEPMRLAWEDPAAAVHIVILDFRTGQPPAATSLAMEEILITWCSETPRPDPLRVAPLGRCAAN
jgi:hypothetical protein